MEATEHPSDEKPERHEQFVPLIAAIARVGESSQIAPDSLRLEAVRLHDELAHGLIPHAIGEGRTVFPVLRRITGSSQTTGKLTEEHREIGRLTDELERVAAEITGTGPGTAHERALREILSGLRSTIERHFEAEDQACFEVLSAELGPEEALKMCRAMESAAAEIRRLYE